MCGIAGIVRNDGLDVDRGLVAAMCAAIRHRGPDDDGFYFNGPVGLGMRRLSIIDVKGGQQPIHNQDRTAWIVFNGEIYNYRELRKQLETKGHSFKTQTDTEVLLTAFIEWGDGCLPRLNGMFHFAVWDNEERTMTLARDHVGIRPLFYTWIGRRLAFASEIKALLASGMVLAT